MSSSLEQACPGVAAMKLLEQKWSLQVLRALMNGPTRFCQLQEEVSGVNPATLSRRLKQLEEEQIVVREVLNNIPPWVEYELTRKGSELVEIVDAIERWGDKWAVDREAVS